MANTSTHFSALQSEILLPSVVFKFIAMIIGVLGNITVIIYTIFLSKEKTATSCLVGNLALADLLVCLTFYPIWIIEFIQTILNIESDQDLFCKLSLSTIWALLFASVATLLALTFDRYLYIAKPLKYPLIVTKRRVFVAISAVWLTTCCLFIIFLVYAGTLNNTSRSLCYVENNNLHIFKKAFIGYFLPTLIMILNVRILFIAEKQRKCILAETVVAINTSNGQAEGKMAAINRFFHALKAVKTFSIVVAVLIFCVLAPSVIGLVLDKTSCSLSCEHLWHVVFIYEFYGINSVVNAYIYGMRHIKYRKTYGRILFKVLHCNRLTN